MFSQPSHLSSPVSVQSVASRAQSRTTLRFACQSSSAASTAFDKSGGNESFIWLMFSAIRASSGLLCAGGTRVGQGAEAFGVGRASHAAIRDDGRDHFVWSDIEREVVHPNTIWSQFMFVHVRHFPWISLLDRDVFAGCRCEIDCRERRRNIEWNVVLLCQHGYHVRSDLVRRVPIRCNPIGADDNAIDFALLHHVTGHVVRDYSDRDVVLAQFPRR